VGEILVCVDVSGLVVFCAGVDSNFTQLSHSRFYILCHHGLRALSSKSAHFVHVASQRRYHTTAILRYPRACRLWSTRSARTSVRTLVLLGRVILEGSFSALIPLPLEKERVLELDQLLF
jgi:hypothetical protein